MYFLLLFPALIDFFNKMTQLQVSPNLIGKRVSSLPVEAVLKPSS